MPVSNSDMVSKVFISCPFYLSPKNGRDNCDAAIDFPLLGNSDSEISVHRMGRLLLLEDAPSTVTIALLRHSSLGTVRVKFRRYVASAYASVK